MITACSSRLKQQRCGWSSDALNVPFYGNTHRENQRREL